MGLFIETLDYVPFFIFEMIVLSDMLYKTDQLIRGVNSA